MAEQRWIATRDAILAIFSSEAILVNKFKRLRIFLQKRFRNFHPLAKNRARGTLDQKISLEDYISKWSQAYWLSESRAHISLGRVITTRGSNFEMRQNKPKIGVLSQYVARIWARWYGFRVSGDDATQNFQKFRLFATRRQKNLGS